MQPNIPTIVDMYSSSKTFLASLQDTTTPSKSCDFVARYTVIKNSWRGLTNIRPETDSAVQFLIHTKNVKNGSTSNMSFTCASEADRADLLTDVERFREKFDSFHAHQLTSYTFEAKKYGANNLYYPVSLRVNSFGVEQLDEQTGSVIGEYLFSQIKGLTFLEDSPLSLVIAYGPQMKLHLFQAAAAKRITSLIALHATKFIGLPPYKSMNRLQQAQFDTDRLGVSYGVLEAVAEFSVSKFSKRHRDRPVHRLLSTTHLFLVERLPETYDCISAHPLMSIFSLVRCPDDDQKLCVQFKEPYTVKVYLCPQRDPLLAHILEACRGSGNANVNVVRKCVDRGKRFCALRVAVPEEIEKTLLSSLIEPGKIDGSSAPLLTVIDFFNANIDYNGLSWSENKDSLFGENREKLIYQAVQALLSNFPITRDPAVLEQCFNALRRLTLSRVGFSLIAVMPILAKEVAECSRRALQLQEVSLTHAVVELLNTLMTPHHNHYEIKHELVNKGRIAGSEGFVNSLIVMLSKNVRNEGSSLVVLSLLNFFEYVLCPPYSETTDSKVFDTILKKMVQIVGKGLFQLLAHPCDAIRYAAGRIIRSIMEEGSDAEFQFMQQASLAEGGFLHEFNVAAFSTNRPSRDLARRLLAHWTFENTLMQDLLRRMLPITLLRFLQSSEEPPPDEVESVPQKEVQPMTDAYRDSKSGLFRRSFYPPTLLQTPRDEGARGERAASGNVEGAGGEADGQMHPRLRSIRPSTGLNWTLFFYQIKQNHMRPDLIWNQTTRNELKNAIEAELEAFCAGQNFRSERSVAWNYQEFEVVYHSLAEEVKIGQHYPRLLFESQNPIIARPREFFDDLYHHFLIVDKLPAKLEALHGMARLYNAHATAIGELRDLSHFVHMFRTTTVPLFRDRLLLFFREALKARHNVKLFLDAQGLESLVEQVTLAQLHIDRPQLRAVTNAIESSCLPEGAREEEKEWYYHKDGAKSEPVSFTKLKELYTAGEVEETVKVWAQGMLGWKPLCDVPQLRWGIVCVNEPSSLTYTAVTCTILDILQYVCDQYPSRNSSGAVMQPLPKVKRYLSGPTVLPHIVQLLLTFDSAVCERVNRLLYSVMEDNPLMGRLFLTGYYYFSLIYTASDVLPFSRMLHMTHNRQSLVYHSNSDAVTRKSVLEPLLPPAMVCFLTNYGPEKFAEVFLGEYETPEIIWGKNMRLFLANKIAAHIADFLPRLLCNNTLPYQYCPIVSVAYEQLRQELFCSEYYLRHLCDTLRYPNWPIRDAVAFLCSLLSACQAELNKEPCGLSSEGCLSTLELTLSDEAVTPQQIRKAYFELATRYHPDKNPEGRERFQAIHEAYTFLMSDTKHSDKPNPQNIYLILQSQCILYKSCAEDLKAYKYAGYELLFKLLGSELADREMLQKQPPIVLSAAELCRLTVENVPLNADELQAEGGIELLGEVVSRCFDLITSNSAPDAIPVKVATHCMWIFATVAQFTESQRKICDFPEISYLTARGVAYEHTLELSRACIRACEAQCLDPEIQARLIRAGVVWHLLRTLLRYDPTLERAGVNLKESHHTQLSRNRTAVFAMKALCALAGFVPDTTYRNTRPNDVVRRLLERLLTPYLVQMIATTPGHETEALCYLNGNFEMPCFYWNHACRAELEELLETNSYRHLKGEIDESQGMALLCAEGFFYTQHQNEVQVGGIFLRLYKAHSEFRIRKPAAFFLALIENLETRPSETDSASRAALVVTSLNFLVRNHLCEIEKLADQHAATLVETFGTLSQPEALIPGLSCLECLMDSEHFAESICEVRSTMSRVAILLGRPAEVEVHKSSLQLLMRLLAHRSMVQDVLDCGMYLILLLLYVMGGTKEVKEMSCVCLGKALCDKLVGPKLFLSCAQYLPHIFLDAIKEGNPTQACAMLDTDERSPELIWNEERREQLVQRLSACRDDIVCTLTQNPLQKWRPPLELDPAGKAPVDEIQVGGIFLSLYVQSPMWQVRKPKEFLVALLERYAAICQRVQGISDLPPSDVHLLELLTQSGVYLLRSSGELKDHSASLGYMHRLVLFSASPHEVVAVSALRWLNEVWTSSPCVASTAPADPIGPLLRCCELHPTAEPLMLDTLAHLFSAATPRAGVLARAAQHHLVEKLLQRLESDATQGQEPPAATRARVIKVIKAMVNLHDPVNGPNLEAVLRRNPVWEKYKDQSHDLFLRAAQPEGGGYLTDGTAPAATSPAHRHTTGEALALTFPAHLQMRCPTEPPPLHVDK